LTLTKKQAKALDLLNNSKLIYYLFDGSARCGKTYAIIKFLCAYGYKYQGIRILIARYRFNHAKASVWEQTLLPLLKAQYDGHYTVNKSDFIVRFSWGTEIWLAGTDDSDRLEKILGTEWAIIFLNEGTQATFDIFNTLKSRLNWQGVPLKYIVDCNPRNPSHWLHKQFINNLNPQTKEPLPAMVLKKQCRLNWHVFDNTENLSKEYIEVLESMSGVKKKRLFDGIWCDSVEGTVYRFNREKNIQSNLVYHKMFPTFCCWDFGVMDDTAIIWFQVASTPKKGKGDKGILINIIDEYSNNNQPVDHYVDVVMKKPYSDVQHYGDPAGSARSQSLESWISKLRQLSGNKINVKYTTGHTVLELIDNANDFMPYVRVSETLTPKVVEMFENWSFQKDKDDKVPEGAKPVHDEYSHFGTAWYYGMINRFPIKNTFVGKY